MDVHAVPKHTLYLRGFVMNTTRRPSKFLRKLIRQIRKLNLFTRLLLVFTVLLVASTMFITVFNQSSYAREIETGHAKYLSVLVQNASFKLEQEQARFEQSMRQLMQNEQFVQAVYENILFQNQENDGDTSAQYEENTKMIEKTLLSTKRRRDGIKAILFVSDDTQYVMEEENGNQRSIYVRDLEEFSESDIYKQAVNAQGYPAWRDSVGDISDLFYENPTHQFPIEGCITLSYQVYEPDSRRPMGVLVCLISPQYFTQALSEYSSQNGGNTFIVGNNGLVEGISADFSAPPFMEQRSGLIHRVFSQHQGSIPMEVEKEKLLVSFCGPPNFPIHVVNLTYRDHILEKVDRIRNLNSMILLIVILIGSGGFYLTAVSISYPVNKLIRAMKKVGSGDFSAVYQAESHDEIGVLCQEFDHMVSDMQGLIDRVYVAEIRERELELTQKTAQLDALQMQISPHFLYNTLDMIRWECLYEAGGESAASDMIEKFCALLRMTIKGDQQKETVQESLLHSSTYLEVVNFRHTNKILLEMQMSFDPAEYMIPCLSLQPILENAVRHGFEVDQMSQRKITITGDLCKDRQLVMRISDNGKGMTAEELRVLQAHLSSSEISKTGIGLRNVNQRCHLCYGQDYGIRIESELGYGTTVILTIPAEPSSL